MPSFARNEQAVVGRNRIGLYRCSHVLIQRRIYEQHLELGLMLGKSSLLAMYEEDSDGTEEQETGTAVKYDGEGCRFCVLQITRGAHECCDFIDRLGMSISQSDSKLQAAMT